MIRLTGQPFDPGAELNRFCQGRSRTGAVASFVGLARGEEGQATALELEAYPGFTESEIGKMVAAATARFDLDDARVVHRVGAIPPGEAIVLVLTAAAHRREAFDACDFLMDYLKSRAPLWKKEHGADGPRWVEPTARDLADIRRWDDGMSDRTFEERRGPPSPASPVLPPEGEEKVTSEQKLSSPPPTGGGPRRGGGGLAATLPLTRSSA